MSHLWFKQSVKVLEDFFSEGRNKQLRLLF